MTRWVPHYTQDELIEELDRFEFPERFWFGTSTSGYQAEGGHNGSDDPKNNWYHVEFDGHVEATGQGARFWDKYKEDMEYAALMGCNGFRMGLEWSRIQPHPDPEHRNPASFDSVAIDRYADMIALCQELGMLPAVTLFHWTSPLWMGKDPWLDREQSVECFLQYVTHTVTTINQRLISFHKTQPIPYFITMNEPAAMPMGTYLGGVFPSGTGRSRKHFLSSFENLLLAHVRAYEAIHEIYQRHQWKRPTVTINPLASGVYSSDLMLLDILTAPGKGIDQDRIFEHLAVQRKEFYQKIKQFPHRDRQSWLQRSLEGVLLSVSERIFGKRSFSNLINLTYSLQENGAPWLDVMSFDFYDPFFGNYLDTSGLIPRPRMQPWEWGVSPDCLGSFFSLYQRSVPDLPIHILENGMSYAQQGEEGQARHDGANRIDVLKAHLFACIKSMNRGVPVEAYYYWTLSDNYEWGSFVPRFGMLNVDYQNGSRRRPVDAVGNNIAGAYKAIITAFFAKDKDALREAFLAKEYALLFPK